MKLTKQIKLMIVAATSVFSLSGCSGGSTATGLGLSVGGSWKGQLMVNGSVFANFNMSIQQAATDSEDPFSDSDLTGTFNSDSSCIGGGELSGTISGSSLSITVNELSMTGQSGNTNMSGSWFNTAEEEADPVTTARETAVVFNAASCNTGGTWSASR